MPKLLTNKGAQVTATQASAWTGPTILSLETRLKPNKEIQIKHPLTLQMPPTSMETTTSV